MIPLKKNFSYLILNSEGQIDAFDSLYSETGAYLLDTRMLSKYRWDFAGFTLVHTEYIGSRCIKQHFSKFEQHKQSLLIIRTLTVTSKGFIDELVICNDDIQPHSFTANLELGSDFIDMFEVRGHVPYNDLRDVHQHQNIDHYDAHYIDKKGIKSEIQVNLEGFKFNELITLAPKQKSSLVVRATYTHDLKDADKQIELPELWLRSDKVDDTTGIYRQAEMDLHDLLLTTEQGTTIAAGIPWFVTPFGRDSIITAWFLLKQCPELAKGTLRFLAANQGKKFDEYRDEQPGKILHEKRFAELSRNGVVPFSCYYGTADATPLFIILLRDYCRLQGNLDLANELKDNWVAALEWMEKFQDKRGLIVFKSNKQGLVVQSWKDSNDSLHYGDGNLGEGTLAVAEVQGYAYAAYIAVADFYRAGGDDSRSERYAKKAEELKRTFEDLYWMPEHNNFAIAVDEKSQQLDVNSSDSGHLLWSGIVSEDKVNKLVERLFQEDLWSGWGLRTLSTQEKRYNPISYHNGSVWPHDTAIFAAGLKKYGFEERFYVVKEALTALACTQVDKRLPELFAGYQRDTTPVLPYVEACRPQAWSAAALVYLMNNGE